ncbi:MAG TPA: DUF3710 domain-containing protein [Nocardioidaceae bacterium]
MRFRRNRSDDPAPDEEVATPEEAGAAVGDGPRADGPWDASEVEIDENDPSKVDLGSLIVTGRPGLELRLQVEEPDQRVAAVLLMNEQGAVELRAFAAPRNGDIWDDVRRQIAAETSRRGGTATEAKGPYGTELHVVMNVTTPDGQPATQPSRVLGIAGPRWLLRATFLGRPAMQPDPDGEIEAALRDVVVVRGTEPMAPGDPLPLAMPSNARLAEG